MSKIKLHSRLARQISLLFWWVLSIPLFFKILGIGVLVATVFGGITLLTIRNSTSRALDQVARQRAQSIAQSLATSLEEPMIVGDATLVNQRLRRTKEVLSDIRYLVVRDGTGRIVTRLSDSGPTEDPPHSEGEATEGRRQIQVVFNPQKFIFEVTVPIAGDQEGILQLGITDQTIRTQLAAITQSLLWTLALCAAIGAGLALLLTYAMTHPIHHLVQATNRIRSGDFEARADVFSADEIGRLAVAFNHMSDGLQRFRHEVHEKEKARLALIEKIVHTQEEERKTISRELHDQLGQSLLALMLMVQSVSKESPISGDSLCNIELQIREVLEEVRRLAWGMRPSVLDDYGLDRALSRLVEEIHDHSHLAIDYQYTGSPELGRLSTRIEVTLYRIAQESIANIVRHAAATQSSVVVLQRRNEVTLLVEDNGCGFKIDPVQQNNDSCLGLMGMRERAALLGGSCAVESILERGTTIRVTIPFEEVRQ